MQPNDHRQLSAAFDEATRLIESDPVAAAEKARQIVAAVPASPAAHRLLGAALRQSGDNQAANEAELAAISASADDPHIVEAGQAMVAGDLPRAEAILRTILTERPDEVAAIRMLAEIAANFGLFRDSEQLLRGALRLAPGFEYARLHLAMVLHSQNRSGEALSELRQINLANFDVPEVRALHASVLARVGEYDAAIALYREIVAAEPDKLEAWTSLAFLYKTVGQAGEAVEACRAALRHSPLHGEAWWMLADLKTHRFDDSDVRMLEEALASKALADDDRLRLHFTLAKAFEDRAMAEPAFGQLRQANATRAAQVKHDPNRVTELVDRTRRLFTAEFLEAHGESGFPAPDPIFIVGLPRSGSTLIEQILASHPQIEGTAELPDIHVLAKELDSHRGAGTQWRDYPDVLANLDDDVLAELGRRYIERTAIQRKSARPMFIDKMPNNWAHVGFIRLILPKAKIIDARRDPVACGYSNFKQLYARGQEFAYDLGHFGAYYRDYLRLMTHFDAVAPGLVHHVLHERLVDNTEQEVRALLDFVGVPFDAACLRFYESDRPVRTASAQQVRQPIRREATKAWSAYAAFLTPLKVALGSAADTWSDIP